MNYLPETNSRMLPTTSQNTRIYSNKFKTDDTNRIIHSSFSVFPLKGLNSWSLAFLFSVSVVDLLMSHFSHSVTNDPSQFDWYARKTDWIGNKLNIRYNQFIIFPSFLLPFTSIPVISSRKKEELKKLNKPPQLMSFQFPFIYIFVTKEINQFELWNTIIAETAGFVEKREISQNHLLLSLEQTLFLERDISREKSSPRERIWRAIHRPHDFLFRPAIISPYFHESTSYPKEHENPKSSKLDHVVAAKHSHQLSGYRNERRASRESCRAVHFKLCGSSCVEFCQFRVNHRPVRRWLLLKSWLFEREGTRNIPNKNQPGFLIHFFYRSRRVIQTSRVEIN